MTLITRKSTKVLDCQVRGNKYPQGQRNSPDTPIQTRTQDELDPTHNKSMLEHRTYTLMHVSHTLTGQIIPYTMLWSINIQNQFSILVQHIGNNSAPMAKPNEQPHLNSVKCFARNIEKFIKNYYLIRAHELCFDVICKVP